MSFTQSLRLLSVAAGSTYFLAACSVDTRITDEHIASTQDPIINGSSINPSDTGVVILSNECSGTLMTNWKVLTAKHCVVDYVANPSALWVTLGTSSTFANQLFLHPEQFRDVAVIWLQTPLPMAGSTTGYRRNFAIWSAEALNGGVLIIDGYGWNTATGGGGPQNLRRGTCSAAYRAPGLLSCFPGAGGTIQNFGDSGGPGSIYAAGLPVVYVQSGCFHSSATGLPYECYGDTSDVWGEWAFWLLQ